MLIKILIQTDFILRGLSKNQTVRINITIYLHVHIKDSIFAIATSHD